MPLTEEEMMYILKKVRTIAWISFADDRTVEEKDKALREILVATREIGNEPNHS